MAAAALAVAAAVAPLAASEAGQATFTVTIKNVATDKTLKLPDGSTSGAPIAPGAYAIVEDGVMLFEPGKPAGSGGLESLGEDGKCRSADRQPEGDQRSSRSRPVRTGAAVRRDGDTG